MNNLFAHNKIKLKYKLIMDQFSTTEWSLVYIDSKKYILRFLHFFLLVPFNVLSDHIRCLKIGSMASIPIDVIFHIYMY